MKLASGFWIWRVLRVAAALVGVTAMLGALMLAWLFLSIPSEFAAGPPGLVQEFYSIGEDGSQEFLGMQVVGAVSADLRRDILRYKEFHNNTKVVWRGVVQPQVTGRYRFALETTGSARLALAGKELIAKQEGQGATRSVSEGAVWLLAGTSYEIQVEWERCELSYGVNLMWHRAMSGAGSWENVPSDCLFQLVDNGLPRLDSVDLSRADLDMASAGFGGEVRFTGEHLNDIGSVEFVPLAVASPLPRRQADVLSSEEASLVVRVPANLAAGTYIVSLGKVGGPMFTGEVVQVIAEPSVAIRTEHPRPDWARDDWTTLNGTWDFAFDPECEGLAGGWQNVDSSYFDMRVNVPYSWTSADSGIGNDEYSGQAWYRREFEIDSSWTAGGGRVFVHFGAVDANCRVFVNGTEVISHEGGYTPFEADVTDLLSPSTNVITVWVEDEGSYGDDAFPALVGKQGHDAPCGYTKTCGIWQSVWLERRGASYVEDAVFSESGDALCASMSVSCAKAGAYELQWSFASALYDFDSGIDVPTGSTWEGSWSGELEVGATTVEALAPVEGDLLRWSANEPNLYYGTLTLRCGDDVVDVVRTYFGVRDVAVAAGADGVSQIAVNGELTYLKGVLDQGFWLGGVYTAPTAEALGADVSAMKSLGFNLVRKHLKVEDPIQYWWCDRVGVYVWQDIPYATAMNVAEEGGAAPGRALYERCLRETCSRDVRHPCIISVILMNETWGIDKPGQRAADGMTTEEWQVQLYDLAKILRPDVLVEDMSPIRRDHIQPTDLNTFHVYPATFDEAEKAFGEAAGNTYPGSTWNFRDGYTQDGEPLLASEYGQITAYGGEGDVEDAFLSQTKAILREPLISGFVYTEAYDVEYERNGLFTYGREQKVVDYDKISSLVRSAGIQANDDLDEAS